jgi:hypothetical protein
LQRKRIAVLIGWWIAFLASSAAVGMLIFLYLTFGYQSWGWRFNALSVVAGAKVHQSCRRKLHQFEPHPGEAVRTLK